MQVTDIKGNHSKTPWTLAPASQDRIDALINSVLVPFGEAKAFEVAITMFQQTSMLKMAGAHHILITLMPLILFWASPDIDVAYKSYFLMLQKDLSFVLKPTWRDSNELDYAEDTINELAALHEGLFPLSEQVMIQHQFVHFHQFIREYGAISNAQGFSGERNAGILKKFMKRTSGSNNEYGVVHEYESRELKSKRNWYQNIGNQITSSKDSNESVLLGPSLHYDPVIEQIISTEHRVVLNQKAVYPQFVSNDAKFEQFCHLLIAMRSYGQLIQPVDAGSLFETSPLLRCVFCSRRLVPQYKQLNHLGWTDLLLMMGRMHIDYLNGKDVSRDYREFTWSNCVARDETVLKSGQFLLKDLIILVGLFDSVFSSYYKNAVIYGTKFKSRGMDHHEGMYAHTDPMVYDQQQRGDKSSLSSNWHFKDQYSSWCKLRKDLSSGDSITNQAINSNHRYAQVNGFFRIQSIDDPIFHNVPFAFITPRDVFYTKCISENELNPPGLKKLQIPTPSEEINFLTHVAASNNYNYIHCRQACDHITPLISFFSTNVLVLPMYKKLFTLELRKNNLQSHSNAVNGSIPYSLSQKNISDDKRGLYANYLPNVTRSDISFLTLIDLHPARCFCFKYESMTDLKYINVHSFDAD